MSQDERGAVISDCGLYRYRLERAGRGSGSTAIVMVNPSTADATQDDATIRKLRGFGDRFQWGRLIVGNLFAFRAKYVRELATAPDPVGPENDSHLRAIFGAADRLIVAWGPLGKQPRYHKARWRKVMDIARETGLRPLCLATAKDGHPCHPLMLAYACAPEPWTAKGRAMQ